MKRREFIAGTAALLVSPRRLWAQGTPRRVGVLGGTQIFANPKSVRREPARSRLDRGEELDHRLPIFRGPSRAHTGSCGRTRRRARSAHWHQPADSRSPEIGNCYHSDCIRGCGRSRGARSRPKPVASGRQCNGSYGLRAGRVLQQIDRNTAGNCSCRLENCDPCQSGQSSSHADSSPGCPTRPRTCAWLCR